MASSTPALLALDLGVTQKRIRDVLRQAYGPLPTDVSRWELDQEQVQRVRDDLAAAPHTDQKEWGLEPGDTVRRREIHEAYGGQEQGGISTPRAVPEVLIFTDPIVGTRYGYDMFEGLREDGSYAYTGEGQYGDQELKGGNRAIHEAAAKNKRIRLFRKEGVNATYVGVFTTDDVPYEVRTIPDAAGNLRKGYIFNLVPVEADTDLLPIHGEDTAESEDQPNKGRDINISEWVRPDFSDIVLSANQSAAVGDRTIAREEFKLQVDFGDWLENQGTPAQKLRLRSGMTHLEPDFYVQARGWIVEAKKSWARGHVRTAIGQVLDYAYVAKRTGRDVKPVVLLPGKPQEDLIALIHSLGIVLVVPSEDGFHEVND